VKEVRSMLAAAIANSPKGQFSNGEHTWEVGANDQLFKAAAYSPLIVAYRNGAARWSFRRWLR
jgi:multidrug efflux pump